jgi:hypothetical protein
MSSFSFFIAIFIGFHHKIVPFLSVSPFSFLGAIKYHHFFFYGHYIIYFHIISPLNEFIFILWFLRLFYENETILWFNEMLIFKGGIIWQHNMNQTK